MAKTTNANDKPTLNIKGMTIGQVRALSDNVTGFSLLGNGLGLYNLKIIEGRNGKFIAAPSEKGQDGKWYPQYAVYFSDDDQAKIIKAVEAKLPSKEMNPEDIF